MKNLIIVTDAQILPKPLYIITGPHALHVLGVVLIKRF